MPLRKAVHCQKKTCVIILLEHGTNLYLMDVYSNIALYYTVYNENRLLAEKLPSHHVNTEVLEQVWKHTAFTCCSLQNTVKGGILVKKQQILTLKDSVVKKAVQRKDVQTPRAEQVQVTSEEEQEKRGRENK
ncbi:putative ankyrin repeat domain-containing protein 19 [Plecturocebus cupreus]